MSLQPTIKILKDDRRELDRIMKNLKLFNGRYLLVGIFGNMNRKGKSIANIMATHEFGSIIKRIPCRSWMRKFVDGNKYDVDKKVATICTAIVMGKMNSQKGLQIMGVWLTGKFKSTIRSLTSPALSFKTVKRKKSSKLLIDTAQSINSIKYRIQKHKPVNQ